MSEERIPSEQQISMLRARLVRFQLYSEAAGLWPGAASFSGCGDDAIRAAAEFMRLCGDAALLSRTLSATDQGKATYGGWPRFWFAGIEQMAQELAHALTFLAMNWLVDYDHLSWLNGMEHIAGASADSGWTERFIAFAPGSASPRAKPRGVAGEESVWSP